MESRRDSICMRPSLLYLALAHSGSHCLSGHHDNEAKQLNSEIYTSHLRNVACLGQDQGDVDKGDSE